MSNENGLTRTPQQSAGLRLESREVFADPVSYLRELGIEAEVVEITEAPVRAAA